MLHDLQRLPLVLQICRNNEQQSQYDKLKCELQKLSPDETTGGEIDTEKEQVAKRTCKKTIKNAENVYQVKMSASVGSSP